MMQQTILWRRLDWPGHDACGLRGLLPGWQLAGTAVFCEQGQPYCLSYRVVCDRKWHTQSALIRGWIGGEEILLDIVCKPSGHWRLNGLEQPDVEGFIDLDLAFTPATNLIPLRRLQLGIGEQADAPAAWLDLAEQRLQRLQQRYRRVEHNRYDYESPDVGYAAVLEITKSGFVKDYPGLWQMEALGIPATYKSWGGAQ